MSDIEAELSCLAGDYSKLSARIRHIDYDTTACGERIEVRASYISFRDSEPTVDEFVETISNFIVPFCLPRSEVRQASQACQGKQPNEQASIFSALHQRAVDLFIRAKLGSSRSGELGEIALFILVEWLLKAPQIVSKMYLKTSNNMPVHGTDGIHIRYDAESEKLLMYWGESKAHQTLSGALASALQSIKEFTEEAMGLGLSRFTAGKLNQLARRTEMAQDEARAWLKGQHIEALDVPNASRREIERMLV